MNTDTANVTADELDGERGIPSVNEEKRVSPKRAIGFIVVLLVLFVTAALLYRTYIRHQKTAAEAGSGNSKELAVPSAHKSFGPLPMPDAPSNLAKPVAPAAQPVAVIPAPGPTRPQQLDGGGGANAKPPATLDKSGSSMMLGGSSKSRPEPANEPLSLEATGPGADSAQSLLASLLEPTSTAPASARVLADRDYLLTKGTMIDCALLTKLDTTVPGMTSCVVTRPIYSDNGRVLLIDRGSVISGEYKSGLKQGAGRIFVLWDRVKTPNGVVVSLNSPGTDALGGAGLPGYVNSHFWKRFGGAIMLSLIQDSLAAAVASQQSGQTINLGNSSNASDSMASEALKATINIPPTLMKNQGDRVGIYVARDLSFRSVYELRGE